MLMPASLSRSCPVFPKFFSYVSSSAISPSQRFSSSSFFLNSLQNLVASRAAHRRFISQLGNPQFAGLSSFELMTPSIPSRSYSRKENATASRSEEATGAEVEQAESPPVHVAEEQQDSAINIKRRSSSKRVSRNTVEGCTTKDDVQRNSGKDPKYPSKDILDNNSVGVEPTHGQRADNMQELQLLENIGILGEGEFHALLTAEDQRNGFSTLSVTNLQEILIKIGRRSTGCREELIMEVYKFLAEHQRKASLQGNETLIPKIEVIKACTYKRKRQWIGQTSVLNMTHLTDMDGQNQVIGAECRQSDRAGEAVSPYRFFPQCESQPELLGLDSELLQGDVIVKEMEKTHQNVLMSEMTDNNIDNPKKVEIVYTRRSKRKSVAKQILTVEEDAKPTHDNSLENLSKNSKTSSYDLLSCAQNDDKKTTVSELPPPPKKLRLVVKGPRPPKAEVFVSSKTQKIEVSVMSETPWTVLVHNKVQPGWIVYNPATMRPGPLDTGMPSVKLLSWNVNGIRALLKEKSQLDGSPISRLAERENFDVLCLQETKLQEKNIMEIKPFLLPGYDNSFWSCSIAKLGYSGTAVISRIKPLSVVYGLGIPNLDKEGRLITVEFDTFYLVAGYIPNSGQKLERLAYRTQEWDISLSNFLKELEKSKPIILTGDLNCAHQEMDIFNPDGNRKSAGFTNEERASFEDNFLKRGLVDTFRRQHPQAVAYTYWGHRFAARSSNKGWRLDYFLASDSISELVHDSYVLPDVVGSDHCPIGLILRV